MILKILYIEQYKEISLSPLFLQLISKNIYRIINPPSYFKFDDRAFSIDLWLLKCSLIPNPLFR